uniref:uncharacterized protein LOC120343394 isoform X1 n=1 Tax=Styela clava TaxID=7725 RepID=UPI0019393D69|nr:uncharacterized protein LOC120343394 isoform X1 [Styela clava]
MTDSSSLVGTGTSSMSKLISFTKKRPFSASSSKSVKRKENTEKMKGTTNKTKTESAPDTMLEPFQEMVDEINWGNLDDANFPMADVSTDKPVASQAVAFVIRASRRGVVPLCAEVANLLKENSNLEELVNQQKQILENLNEEVEALRKIAKGPPPEMKDAGLQTIQEIDCQTMTVDEASSQTDKLTISCIRHQNLDDMKHGRQDSSFNHKQQPDDNEPSKKFLGLETGCGSNVVLKCSCDPLVTTATQNPILISVAVNTVREDCMDSALGYFEHTSLEKTHRDLEEQHSNLIEKNTKMENSNEDLDRDLKSAKEEIVTLQRAIQEIQNKEYEREKEAELMRQHETYSVDVQNNLTSSDEYQSPPQQPGSRGRFSQLLPLITADSATSSRPTVSRTRSSIFPGPILGCKCQMCTAFFRSSGLLGFACSPYVTDSSGRNPVLRDLRRLVWLQNSKLQIQPKDQIIARNNRVGTVRYVGHLDGVGTPSVVYIGMELDNQEGRHDGYLNGKRYFFCPHKHGLFIPLQDVLCVINRKVTPPSAHPPIRDRPPAIIGRDGAGKISHVSIAEFGRRRRRKKTSATSTSGSSTTSDTSSSISTTTSEDEKIGNLKRFPELVVS